MGSDHGPWGVALEGDIMKKLLCAAAVCATTMTLGGVANAGEITGSGQGGPNGDGVTGMVGNASSICAFSGLDDPDPDPFGRVQSYGAIPKEFRPEAGSPDHPGSACNPSPGGD